MENEEPPGRLVALLCALAARAPSGIETDAYYWDVPQAPLRLLTGLIVLRRTQDDLAVDRQRLQDDVVAVAILVHERRADGEPKVVLAFAL